MAVMRVLEGVEASGQVLDNHIMLVSWLRMKSALPCGERDSFSLECSACKFSVKSMVGDLPGGRQARW